MNNSQHSRKRNLDKDSNAFLETNEPPAIETFNQDGSCALLIVCDHASKLVPRKLKNLGLNKTQCKGHIAYDIGAAEVTRLLAQRLNAQAILAGYSRLVIDLNRPPEDPQSILKISDDTFIPGNQGLNKYTQNLRVSNLFDPYHSAINKAIVQLTSYGKQPALLSIHSFSPEFGSKPRPWDIGVLWNRDPRIADPLKKELNELGLIVGDNLPYSGRELAYTINLHGAASGIANCAVEINQSQIRDTVGIKCWSGILEKIIQKILKIDALYENRKF